MYLLFLAFALVLLIHSLLLAILMKKNDDLKQEIDKCRKKKRPEGKRVKNKKSIQNSI